jgi:hypothetical protein
MLVDAAAAFASCRSRNICSLRTRTSDFGASPAEEVVGVEGLGSAAVSTDLVVPAFVVLVDALASSTSPSSTSILAGALGVETPRELRYH